MKHFNKNLIKVSTLCVASAMLFSLNSSVSRATTIIYRDEAVAGISLTLDNYYGSSDILANTEITIAALETSVAEYNYDNLGVANVENHLNIRKEPGEDKTIIGKLPKDAGCTIIEYTENGWVKIKSGKVTGYVKASYLITGEEAVTLAKKVGSLMATVVGTATLNVRSEANLLGDNVITSVPMSEELEVIEVMPDWIKISIDNDEGFVARQYTTLSYELKKAVTEDSSSGESGTRGKLVAYAKKFLGNRYVWGGTSLTNGVDCSGFTQAIYKQHGYSIPRTSREQANAGKSISSSEIKAGDLVFYASGNYINHVAIYIGNGQVIHASNPRSGIKISKMNYRTPYKIVRVINN